MNRTRLGSFLRATRLTALIGALLALIACGNPAGTYQLPVQASEQAKDVDWLFYFVFWLCVIYFVHIVAAMLWFMWRYRRRPGVEPEPSPHHNTALEVAWSIPPIILCAIMFWWGFLAYIDLFTPPENTYKIHVTASKWKWEFTYPNGMKSFGGMKTDLFPKRKTGPGLHLPPDTPVEMIMESNDVLHAFFIPQFRIKQDIVPGRWTNLWFTAKIPTSQAPGKQPYKLFCAEYCGTEHSQMWSTVTVHDTWDSFEAWVNTPVDHPPEMVYVMNCQSCHSTEPGHNASLQGPTFAGLWGSTHKALDTTTNEVVDVTVDEEYLKTSIRNAGRHLSMRQPNGEAYPDGMTGQNFHDPAKLSDEDVEKLVKYIKELGKGGGE